MPGVIDYDKIDKAAQSRMGTGAMPSRGACWVCGLRRGATVHGTETFWQHEYIPAILTKGR